MQFDDCIKRNMLKKNEDAKAWVATELKTAEKFHIQARAIIEAGQYESAEVISYAAIFHFARALVYSKGYTEKSHYCLLVAISKLFGDEAKEVCTKAQHLREARHNVTYGGKDITKEEAEHAVKLIEEFKDIAESLLEK